MGGPVRVHGRTVVTSKSGGVSFAMGDVCLLQDGTPVPFLNVAVSSDAEDTARTVRVNGVPVVLARSRFGKSTGDEAGEKGGILSGTTKGGAQFTNYAFDVGIEGQGVPRALDPMNHNFDWAGLPNAASPAELQAAGMESDRDILCEVVCFCSFSGREGGKTACVRRTLAAPIRHRGDRVWDPAAPATGTMVAYVEVPFTRGPPAAPVMSDVPSRRLRDSKGAPLLLPKGDLQPIPGTLRPDIVVVNDPTRPPTPDNIKDIYEVKFPPDDWGATQFEDYQTITGREAIELTPQKCGCDGDEPPPYVPLPEPAPRRDEEPEKPLEPVGPVTTFALLLLGLAYLIGRLANKTLPPVTPGLPIGPGGEPQEA